MSVVVSQTAIPDYRRNLFQLLSQELGPELEVLTGVDGFERGVHTSVWPPNTTAISNCFFVGRRALWQRGSVRRLVRADVAVLTLNPRILNVWVVLLARRLLGRRTVLWGHAWPRAGPKSRSDRLRNIMRRLTDALVVYTETQARELRARMPGAEITATPNALYSVNEIGPAPGASPRTFVYVGRLVESKKPGLALDAFLRVRRDLPPDCTLVFVGDGPLRVQLQSTAQAADAQDRVRFLGPCDATDTALLRAIYGESIASVSPGYVGLSIIQSLSFGIPMILARDEPHAPEIEAAAEGENAVIVESDSPDAFGRALVTVARERDSWFARRPAIARRCAERYAVELMAERLLASVRGTATADPR